MRCVRASSGPVLCCDDEAERDVAWNKATSNGRAMADRSLDRPPPTSQTQQRATWSVRIRSTERLLGPLVLYSTRSIDRGRGQHHQHHGKPMRCCIIGIIASFVA